MLHCSLVSGRLSQAPSIHLLLSTKEACCRSLPLAYAESTDVSHGAARHCPPTAQTMKHHSAEPLGQLPATPRPIPFRPGGCGCGTVGYKLISLSLQRMLVSLSALCQSRHGHRSLAIHPAHAQLKCELCWMHPPASNTEAACCSTGLTSCRMSPVTPSNIASVSQLSSDHMPCCDWREDQCSICTSSITCYICDVCLL